MPDDIRNMVHRFAYIELEIAALRKANAKLAAENAQLVAAAHEGEFYKSNNHCPLWPYEIVQMIQAEFPDTAPMFFDNCIRSLKRRVAELQEKYEPDAAEAETA